jgi:hypothetical protein
MNVTQSLKRSVDQLTQSEAAPEPQHGQQLALQLTQLAAMLQQQQQFQQMQQSHWASNLCSPSSVLPGLGNLSVNTPQQPSGQPANKKFKADSVCATTPRHIKAPPATPQARVADPMTTPSRKKKSSSGAVAAKQLLETLLHTLQHGDDDDSDSEEEVKAVEVPPASVEPAGQPQVAMMLAQLQQMQQQAHVAQQQAVLQQQLQGILCAQLLQSSSSAASSTSVSRQGSVPPSPSIQPSIPKASAEQPVPFDSSMYSLVRLPDGSEHYVRRRQSKKNPITPAATPIAAPPTTPMSRTAKRNARLESLQRAASKLATRLREFETPDGLPKDDVVLHLPTPRGKKKAPFTPKVELEELSSDEHAIGALRSHYPGCQKDELLAHLQAHNVKIVRVESTTSRTSKATPSRSKTPVATPAAKIETKVDTQAAAEPVLLPFDEDNNNTFQKFEPLMQPTATLENLFLPVADPVPMLDVGSTFMLDGLMMSASPPANFGGAKHLCLSPLHSPAASMFHFNDSILLDQFDTNNNDQFV